MIPAKQKAIELYCKYAKMWHASPDDVKLSAIIAVDEILDVLGDVGVYSFADIKVSYYWEEVKQEIQKL